MIENYLSKIKTKNIYHEIFETVNPFIERLKQKKEVEGIVLLGGLGRRRFSDVYSDVDLSIFLKEKTTWLPQFEFYISNKSGGFYEINVHQNIIEREISTNWEEEKKEAYEESLVCFERGTVISDLIRKKVIFDHNLALRRLFEIKNLFDCYRLTGEPFNDHLLVNRLLNQLVEVLFLINREYRPHRKWRLEKSMYLAKLPKGYLPFLREVLLIHDLTREDCLRRYVAIKDYFNKATDDISFEGLNYRSKAKRLKYSSEERTKMLTLISAQYKWFIKTNPLRQIERGFIHSAQDLLNEGIIMILESINLINRKPMKNNVDALGVLADKPGYDESSNILDPMLFKNHKELWLPMSIHLLQDAITTKRLDSKEVLRKRSILMKIYRKITKKLFEDRIIPEDPYHYALANCYSDRQLLGKTFAERYSEDLNFRSRDDEKLLKGFINYFLVNSEKTLLNLIDDIRKRKSGEYGPYADKNDLIRNIIQLGKRRE